MTAKDLKNLFEDLEKRGVDLDDLPLVSFESNVGIVLKKHHIQFVKIQNFNETTDKYHIKAPLYKFALIVSPIDDVT